MELGVLGPVEVKAGDQILDAGHARRRAVLAVLLLELGRVVPADVLIDRVWGEGPPASALSTLYGYVARLKAALAQAPNPHVALDRRGFGPSGTPAPAAETIGALLGALDVPPGRIPAGLQAQTALYRSLLAGRRMLLILDNARDEQQVRPLLPGDAHTAVLITSRLQLTGLSAGGDGFQRVRPS